MRFALSRQRSRRERFDSEALYIFYTKILIEQRAYEYRVKRYCQTNKLIYSSLAERINVPFSLIVLRARRALACPPARANTITSLQSRPLETGRERDDKNTRHPDRDSTLLRKKIKTSERFLIARLIHSLQQKFISFDRVTQRIYTRTKQ